MVSTANSTELLLLHPKQCQHQQHHQQQQQGQNRSEQPGVFVVGHVLAGNGFWAHIEYKIRVISGDEEWLVFRRYNQFAELNATLHQAFPEEMGTLNIAFPPKCLFYSTSYSVVLYRTRLLGEFLHNILADPTLQHSSYVQQFLEMDTRGLSPYASRHGEHSVLMEAPLLVRGSHEPLFVFMRRYIVLTTTGVLEVFDNRAVSGGEPLFRMTFREGYRHKSMVWIEYRNESGGDAKVISPSAAVSPRPNSMPTVCLSTGDRVIQLRSQTKPNTDGDGQLDWEIRKWAVAMKQFPCAVWMEPLSPTTEWRQEQQARSFFRFDEQNAPQRDDQLPVLPNGCSEL